MNVGRFLYDLWGDLKQAAKAEIDPTSMPKERRKNRKKVMSIQETFIDAIKTEKVEKVASLIEKVNINAEDATGLSPIQHAVIGGTGRLARIEIVELLLNNGAKIDADLLVLAVKKQFDKKIIDILLNRGIPLSYKNSKQQGWVHLAAKDGSIQKIQVFLNHGLSPNDRSGTGATPLHIAAKKGRTSSCDILLTRNDVDVDAQDNAGLTPLQYAVNHRKKKVGASLCQTAACKLIQAGANVNVIDWDGCTPLFIAASRGDEKVVEALIVGGATLDVSNNSGQTPLHIAVENRQKHVAQLLIEHGAIFSEEIQLLAKSKGWNLSEEVNTSTESTNDDLVIEEVSNAFTKAQEFINTNQFKKARKFIKEKLDHLKKTYNIEEHPFLISLYHQLGYINFKLKNSFQSGQNFKKIVEILEKSKSIIESKEKDIVTYYLLLAYYCQLIDSSKSARYIKEAKEKIYTTHVNDSATLGSYYGNLGILYYNALNMSEAKYWLKKAVEQKEDPKFRSILDEARGFYDDETRLFKIKAHPDFFRDSSACVPFEARHIKSVKKEFDEENDYGNTSTGKRVVFVSDKITKEVHDNVKGNSRNTRTENTKWDPAQYW